MYNYKLYKFDKNALLSISTKFRKLHEHFGRLTQRKTFRSRHARIKYMTCIAIGNDKGSYFIFQRHRNISQNTTFFETNHQVVLPLCVKGLSRDHSSKTIFCDDVYRSGRKQL